jgi:CheY-like chemotaxis protein
MIQSTTPALAAQRDSAPESAAMERTFGFTAEEAIGLSTIEHAPAEALAESRPARGRVLLAEDEPLLRAVIQRILQRTGYSVVCASDGLDALAQWAGHTHRGLAIDALLSDVRMPHMGGLALVRRLREQHPDVPVILMTGYVEGGISAEDIGGPTAVLSKPFDGAVLLAALAALLNTSVVPSASTSSVARKPPTPAHPHRPQNTPPSHPAMLEPR